MKETMQDWLKQNGLQLIILAIGFIVAWSTLNSRVTAMEEKFNQYPSQDWFELKFENIDKSIAAMQQSLNNHIDEGRK